MPSVADAVRAQKELIDAADDAMLREMAKSWLAVEKSLEDKIALLAEEIAVLKDVAGGPLRPGKLYQMERYKSLLAQAQTEVAKYNGYAAKYIGRRQADLVALGTQHATSILEGTLGGAFDRMSTTAVEAMVANTAGVTAEGAPLRQLLFERMVRSDTGAILPGVQERMIATLTDAVAQGWNPKKTAKLLRGDLSGGLDKALVIARTETLRAYRTAAAETYKASGAVQSQIRMAAHTTKTCAACLAAEGQEYPMDEPIPDHPRGRCVGVPWVEGMPRPDFETGEQWVTKQSESTQRSILGDKRYELWKDGDVEFSDFSSATEHAVWGGGVQVTPIKDLAS